MPYELDLDVPFTQSYLFNRGCEWFWSKILICTACNNSFSMLQADEQNWEYCPCCGESLL